MAHFEPGMHYQHSDNPDDSSPWRAGAHCGPQCDLFEPVVEPVVEPLVKVEPRGDCRGYDIVFGVKVAIHGAHWTPALGWHDHPLA